MTLIDSACQDVGVGRRYTGGVDTAAAERGGDAAAFLKPFPGDDRR